MTKPADAGSGEGRARADAAKGTPAPRRGPAGAILPPDAPTRLEPIPFADSEAGEPIGALDEQDESTDAYRGAATAIQRTPLDSDVDFSVDFDSEAGFEHAAPLPDANPFLDAPDVVEDDAAPANPFRDHPTHVDLPSFPSDEPILSEASSPALDADEGDPVDDGTVPVRARPTLPTVLTMSPIVDAAEIPDPSREASPPPLVGVKPETQADASILDMPGTEVEDDPSVDLARWRVIPTGWEPSTASNRPPLHEDPVRRVHTVLWNAEQEAGADGDATAPVGVEPTFSAGVERPFDAGTGTNQLAAIYVRDALGVLDELGPLSQGLEPEVRRAIHAKAFACAQKLRRALSLLDVGGPDDAGDD